MRKQYRIGAVYVIAALLSALLVACGGGGGGGGGSSSDNDATSQPAPLKTRNDVARAAVAAEQFIPTVAGFFRLPDIQNAGEITGGSGSNTTTTQVQKCDNKNGKVTLKINGNSVRETFDNCVVSSGNGTLSQFDGTTQVTCSNISSNGNCISPSQNFDSGGGPLTFRGFTSSNTDQPKFSIDVSGSISAQQQSDTQKTITSDLNFDGRIFRNPKTPLHLHTQNLVIKQDTSVSPATQQVTGGRLAFSADASNNANCLRGFVNVNTETKLKASDNGFSGGRLAFNASNQNATATYNSNESINVANDAGVNQLISPQAVNNQFCTVNF